MRVWRPTVAALVLLGFGQLGRTQPNADEEAIRKVIADANAAWERHDMKTWAQQFAPDADFVNVTGTHWHGRDEIERAHVQLHQTLFQAAKTRSTGLQIKFVRPDVANLHGTWEMVLSRAPDGQVRPFRTGIATSVMVKQSGEWKVVAIQNNDIRPDSDSGRRGGEGGRRP